MQDIEFKDPGAAIAQGITQGVGQGIQLGMQARELAWQKKYQKASMAVQLANAKGIPASAKLSALNKGLLPLLNDERFGMGEKVPEFTADSLKNPAWDEALKDVQAIHNNPDLPEATKLKLSTVRMRDAYMASGEEERAAELQKSLLAYEGQTPKGSTIESILTERVRNGEITLEQAIKMKNEASDKGSKPPAGFRWTTDGQLEVIPGGPADLKGKEKADKAQGLKDQAAEQANIVISKIDQALEKVSGSTAGLGGSFMQKLPGSEAKDLAKDIDTIKANLGFATLQEMRRNSPTGGALGQIAVQELTMLQATVASLDQEQSPAQLKKRLLEIKKHYKKWQEVSTGEGGYSSGTGGASSSSPQTAEDYLRGL